MMLNDIYTKVVLTFIALCLAWLCAMTTDWPLHAQSKPPMVASGPAQPVVIVGWGTVDAEGRVTLARTSDRANPTTDPNIPVKVIGYPVPTRPVEVRLDYSDTRPMPVGITQIRPTGEWAPIRSSVEGEPVRPRPGR
jgi:hypothetical protein